MTRLQRHVLFAGWSVCLFLLASGGIRQLVEFALEDRMVASQIVAGPFITAALLFVNRRNTYRVLENCLFFGASVSILGLLLLGLPKALDLHLAQTDALALFAAGVLATWLGGFLCFYGVAAFRASLFPLSFLLFAIPIPTVVLDATVAVLQRSSADTAHVVFLLTGTPVYREGFVFGLPGLTIEIAPQCSGIRSGIAMLMTSLLGGYLMLSSWWKRAAMVGAALPLLVLKNAIRIDTLSLLSIHVNPAIIEGRLHHEGGVVFFALGLLMLYPVLLLLIKSERNGRSLPGASALDRLGMHQSEVIRKRS